MCMAVPRDLRGNAGVPINDKLRVQVADKATKGLLPLHMTPACINGSDSERGRRLNFQLALLVSLAFFLVMQCVMSGHRINF